VQGKILVVSGPVPKSEKIDLEARERLVRWMDYVKTSRRLTNEGLADLLGLSEPHVTNVLNHKRTPGLDVFLRVVRRATIRADELLNADPPLPIPSRALPPVAMAAEPAAKARKS